MSHKIKHWLQDKRLKEDRAGLSKDIQTELTEKYDGL